ncbi:TPA: hypothetical protein DEP31_00850, partial [Candidatus Azambacteria bacterium]|nr:hypothetical protein [Candidatus Azambacteria bacterium]
MAAKKFWLPARARRKGAVQALISLQARRGVGGIPPRPSVPPERSGGGQFPSKNVRAELYNSTNIKLSDFCPTDSAARSAERYGNTGSPRTARLAKRRFEIPCDFKYLLCPIK